MVKVSFETVKKIGFIVGKALVSFFAPNVAKNLFKMDAVSSQLAQEITDKLCNKFVEKEILEGMKFTAAMVAPDVLDLIGIHLNQEKKVEISALEYEVTDELVEANPIELTSTDL